MNTLPGGWYEIDDLNALCDTVEQCGGMRGAIVEVGVYRGRSAQAMASVIDPSRLVLVDTLESPGACTDTWPEGATWVQGLEARHLDWVNPIAVLHLDGDHSFSGVMADLEKFGPHVVLGGFIVFHDWNEPAAGVSKAWNAWPRSRVGWVQRRCTQQQAIFERVA